METIPALLEEAAARFGDRPLVRCGDVERSYVDTREAAARTAGALAARDVRAGDVVAVVSENRIEVLDLWLGCAWLGAIFCPLNPALKEAQLRHALDTVGPKLVFRNTFLDMADEVPPHRGDPGTPSAILWTSGTTGPPKGVVCPHGQWWWWGVLTGRVLRIRERDVLYTSLPLFHTNALNTFVQAALHGATYVLGERFSASRFWHRLAVAGATRTYLLGAMVGILLRQPPSPHDRAHRTEIALAPGTPADFHEPFLERFGVTLVDGWGSTETNFVLATHLDDPRPGALGRPLPEFDVRVADDGELLVRPREPHLTAIGYVGEEPFSGWYASGDRVAVDSDGVFRFVDRKKETIRRRGENISSWEVEQALLAHTEVAAAAVVGVPSDLGEEEVLAVVVPRAGASLEPAALAAHCAERLATFAVPRYVDVVDALPLTPNGKVEKWKLKERGVTETTWDRDT